MCVFVPVRVCVVERERVCVRAPECVFHQSEKNCSTPANTFINASVSMSLNVSECVNV